MTNPSKPWLKNYPEGVPHEIDISSYSSLVAMFEESFLRFPNRKACEYMGKFLTYRELDRLSKNFAAYIQTLGLEPGARIAVMLPNIVQFQITMLGILRAGYVVVNINPLYTARELEHQLKDSGASTLIILENFAHVYQDIAPHVPLKKVIVTSLGELIGIKGRIVDFVVRKVKKLVPVWNFPHQTFKEALSKGARNHLLKPNLTLDDIAFLQYTGGTTGPAKGAILLHRNILSNVIQTELWLEPGLRNRPIDQLVFLCALPMYHIFALTACALFGMRKGGLLIFVPNPRDIPGFIKLLETHPEINIFPGVNTLFNALIHRPEFAKVKLPNLLVTIGGGMAVQKGVADQWQKMTGIPIAEGYGLSETSPVACVNTPLIKEFTGTIGLPVPSTEVLILDDDGIEVPFGTPGEICIRGPQVMAGYWNKPEETAHVLTADGFFKSGDIGIMNAEGYTKIVDRKKDMIIVSGFKVFPNELEEVIALLPGVLECAAIGVPNEETGEAVKIFIVKKNPLLTEGDVAAYCKKEFTNYKRPKFIEFRDELPKTNVGKILRRELRAS
ncbi:long-chain acyl-CoA synthetase [Polynucleobacter meluiroseus]|uniref:Long-chain-fatty-acid--CoA ligase n=1 Tax=Polynucleobacter meluiroseus TaxID=1938814 RepID=A0A240E3R1_9BURK|nr:long-chain-fatty-acid--CoA ligase [Polynucleobacter meluiroseus]SNX29171.1 long-chain acyl-CoA synthetase [Polynucleobacter meluiroseus]